MTEVIIKSTVGIALSYLIYYSVLRKYTHFRWIRIYFLTSMGVSLVFPALSEIFSLDRQVWTQIPTEYLLGFLRDDQTLSTGTVVNYGTSYFLTYSLYIYLAGTFLVFSRFLFGLIHLLFLTYKFGVKKVDSDRLVVLQDQSSSFSFLHLIFINRQTLSHPENGTILEHERAHIHQWHWLDIILTELLVAFQWFNPFAWLFKKSIKELHEYLADEEVLKKAKSPLNYQLLLFNQACGNDILLPVNAFSSSLTKKRINMINNKKNRKWITIAASLMVAILLIQSFSRINLAQDPPHSSAKDTTHWNKMPPPPPPPPPLSEDNMPAPPPPPPPPPVPFFKGTSTFEMSNRAFADYIMKNTQDLNLPKDKEKGFFVRVKFNDDCEIIKVEGGFSTPEIKQLNKNMDVSSDPAAQNELMRVIKAAPAFNAISHNNQKLAAEVNYMIVFKNGTCRVMPINYWN
jgi:hypothetical protein